MINRKEVYAALGKYESAVNPLAILTSLPKGDSGMETIAEAKKEFDVFLSRVPRLYDLKPCIRPDKDIFMHDTQLEYVKNIANEIFLYFGGKKMPPQNILNDSFIPGMAFDDGIWVSTYSDVDENVIVLPPAMIGSQCTVRSGAVIGPYSCIRNTAVGEGAYVIKSILGIPGYP